MTAGALALSRPVLADAPAPTATASPRSAADASAHFEMGTRHYNLQEWAAAIVEYKEAYRLSARPDILWSIAQAQRLSGDCESAMMTYQAFLRTGPSGAQSALATEAISKCQAALADKRKAGPTPPVEPAPTGSAAPGASAIPPVSSAAPAPKEGVSPAPSASESPPPKPPAWYFDVLGDVLFLGGVVGVAVGGTALGLGNAKAQDVNAAKDYASFERARGEAPLFQTAGVLGLAAGGALVASGLLRFVLVARRPQGDAIAPPKVGEAALGVGAGPSSFSLRVTGGF